MSLHEQAVLLAKDYRRLEGELLSVLEKIRSEKVFLRQGYGSLFEYMVKALALSESTAYSLQTVLRKSEEVPQLMSLVKSGELSLCKAKRIAPVMNRETATQWMELAMSVPTREIDRQVAAANPKVVIERVTPKRIENRNFKGV